MAVSALCLVADNAGPFVPTAGGVNVGAGDTITVQLADTTDVAQWYLQVIGTDELSSSPVLTGVNGLTHLVATPGTTVSFTAPAGLGSALRFQSMVIGTGGPAATTFGIYVLTAAAKRVGAVGEEREGNTDFGWITIVNPLIRTPSGSFTAGGDLTGTSSSQTVAKINGGTAPATPLLADVGKVIGVTGAGAYGLVAESGGTLAGDVTGPAGTNLVSAIQGIPAPDPAGKSDGFVIETHATGTTTPSIAYTTPRSIIHDGAHIYVGQGTQPSDVFPSPIVFKLTVAGGIVTDTSTLDLSISNPLLTQVRDLAQDATYLYASAGDTTFNVAVIDKATLTVVGWADTSPFSGAGTPWGVAADGAGNFYVVIRGGVVLKYSTASVLGQPPTNAVSPTLSLVTAGGLRLITYGGGKLWAVGGSGSTPALYKIDPTALSLDLSTPDLDGDTSAMAVLYAFGSVWVTSGVSGIGVHQVDPTSLAVLTTLAPVGGLTGTIAGISTGADDVSNPDAWIYVSSRDHNKVGFIDPTGPTWISTLTGTVNARYEGVTSIGNFTYFAGLRGVLGSVSTIDWVDVTDSTSGALTAGSPVTSWTLRYNKRNKRRVLTPDITGNYQVLASDDLLPLDSTGGSFIVTLTLTPSIGDEYTATDVTGQAGANPITIDGNGGLISGSGTFLLSTAYDSITVTCTGVSPTRWSIT